jgi:transitional endoplasmic reticulum ATPase
MKLLEAEVGDIVKITGKRTTVAKLMPAFSEDRGKSIIQIDGIIRGNAQVGVDEKVKVGKTVANAASAITLSSSRVIRRDFRYIGKLLEGLPVVKGDAVRVSFFGTRYQEYEVADTRPEGAVVIHPRTSIQFRREEAMVKPGMKITYEAVGGLGKEIKKIREMVEFPLKYTL